METPLSHTGKIDLIINKIYSDKAASFETLYHKYVYPSMILPQEDLQAILDKLVRDGYSVLKPNNYYYLTFEGILFKESGGYQERQRLDKIIADQTELTLSQSQKNADLIVFWTSVASVVGALLLLWQIFVYMYPHQSDWFYFWFQTIPKK